ncbi:flagellar biosynthesis protein FlhA [Alteromonas macleodii]|uniref:flagellar biosynthesis protein FlhA n=1 Tax=Alteromonas macleodii TaxID=28108 RepID=UPI003140A27E
MNFDFKNLNIRGEVGLPLAVLALLAMIVLPLPPLLLDIFFTLSIVISLLILGKTVSVDRPLAFTSFPVIILIATLLRLAMNVASTRVILLEGHNGSGAAGSVIQSFGDFVIGGQYAVGLIVFMILVTINFIVITKGTGRVSEVSARFKLDALPGKQMAIDADLNSQNITTEEAKARRDELTQEADFYGAMDGASKFVKGDAIAGIVILLINIVGGLALGMTTHGLSFSEASESYILLTIGDGIVAQIPGLILSVATGVIITRAGKQQSLGEQVRSEFLASGSNFYFVAAILFVLGVIPGMPNLAFLFFAALVGGIGFYVDFTNQQALEKTSEMVAEEVTTQSSDPTWDDISHVKPIEVLVGYGLIEWVKKDQNEIVNRLRGLRKKLSQELGFLVSPISLQDDINIDSYDYVVKLHGEDVSRFHLKPTKLLGVGSEVKRLPGLKVKEPAFGYDAVWLSEEEKGMAESMGTDVFAPEIVFTTHLSEVIKTNATSLFGFDEAKMLLDKTAEQSPQLVEEYNRKVKNVEVLVRVMKILLSEKVPLKDVKSILQVMVESYTEEMSVIFLAQKIRNALGRAIVNKAFGKHPVELITLESQLQQMLVNNVLQNGPDAVAIEPNLAHNLVESLTEQVSQRTASGKPSVIAVEQHIRYNFANSVGKRVPGLQVIAVDEIPPNQDFEIITTLEA